MAGLMQRPRLSLKSVSAAGLLAVLCIRGSLRAEDVDFNRDIRPILAGRCFKCHGPDEGDRQAGLRLDKRDGATAAREGIRAIAPGKPESSELLRRVRAADPSERMPPPGNGEPLDPGKIGMLERWISEGAPYARHWAFVAPSRPPVPAVRDAAWPRNEIDRFILHRLERERLAPSPEADRYALARRASLDLTGLPPTIDEVDELAADASPDAYERYVDRLLAKPSYGEHWARLWLDLARYADSAGYADDPPRTIWAFRDWVIDAFNEDKPFDEFTIEQLAGDLLPGGGEKALIATAFHRNTQTNNEGGTNDEEYRNVAVVDRVNTTFAAWMGSTIACAQCHSHKYDPIAQEEYFKVFAVFNETEDADRTDETPVLPLFTEADREKKGRLEGEIARLEETLRTPTPELDASQARWEAALREEIAWTVVRPETAEAMSKKPLKVVDDGSILAPESAGKDTYRFVGTIDGGPLAAVRVEALPDPSLPGGGPGHAGGNFVLTGIRAAVRSPESPQVAGRYVRIEIPGPGKILSLAEVEVYSSGDNAARRGKASQKSTAHEGHAALAIDGKTDGRYAEAMSTSHTETTDDPWWEVDLGESVPVHRIVIWNRTDNGLQKRLRDFRLQVLDAERHAVWEKAIAEHPDPSAAYLPGNARQVAFASAHADYTQPGFEAGSVLRKDGEKNGWAVGGETGKAQGLVLVPGKPEDAPRRAKLEVELEQLSKHDRHTLGRFRISVTSDSRAADAARVPAKLLAILRTGSESRPQADREALRKFFLASIAPELEPARRKLADVRKELSGVRPYTTVPVFRELAGDRRRRTRMQHRGNFLDLGKEVTPGVPAVFHPLPEGAPPDRLALARWLVDPGNPLTARVLVNRYWEKIFGIGIVATSEDFGIQGDMPVHPELLDWLAVELVESGWKLKPFLRKLVLSAAYRQSSRVTPELIEIDPENRLLARGPRFRLSAEEIRDQALFAAGLLSPKMHGPPVRPPQPALGLSAAFGGSTDWQTSEGEDRYRRGIYTTWRRSNPYPSMTTFDAPNREVCAVRRARTNTPLQALVTLNDPVHVEAAQALARRMMRGGDTADSRAALGFRLVLARPPVAEELSRLAALHEDARERLGKEPERALRLATAPLGPVPDGTDAVELAAWTVVANVILNLDEALMKR